MKNYMNRGKSDMNDMSMIRDSAIDCSISTDNVKAELHIKCLNFGDNK